MWLTRLLHVDTIFYFAMTKRNTGERIFVMASIRCGFFEIYTHIYIPKFCLLWLSKTYTAKIINVDKGLQAKI
jgi:hypothetical protein